MSSSSAGFFRSGFTRGSRWARTSRQAAIAIVALALALAVAAPLSAQTSFSSGSLIIPMDTTYQNYGMWKSYGLVNKLLKSGIPVSWAIKTSQTSPWVPPGARETDFTGPASGVDLRTNAALPASYAYSGGPFIIDSANAAAATTVINAWWTAQGNQPAVHKATAAFTAPINIVLTRAPLIAVEQINAGIATTYLNAAAIPDSNGYSWGTSACYGTANVPPACENDIFPEARIAAGELFQASACNVRKYDVFVTPHNSGYSYSLTDPANLGTKTYAQLDNFVNQGGGWVALCHSILSNENFIYDLLKNGSVSVKSLFKYYQDNPSATASGFLTSAGFPSIANGGGTWKVEAPDLPIGQVVPTTPAQGLPGGSVQTWNHSLVTYLSGVERIAYFDAGAAQYDHVVNGVYHGGAGRGKLSFLGGHSYSTALPYSSNYEAPYLRMFYNALFFNGAAVAKLDLVPSATQVPQGQSTITAAVKNNGSSTATVTGTLTVTIPAGVTYNGVVSGPAPSSAPAIGSSAGGDVVWNSAGALGGGTTFATLSLILNFSSTGTFQIASLAANYGDVFAETFTVRECIPITVVPTPGVSITKTLVAQAPFYPGDIVTWTIAYSNPGSANLLNPVVQDSLPSQLAYVSASPSPTTVVLSGGTQLRWVLASPLAAGGSGTITLRASISTVTGQPFTNTATLTGNDTTGTVYTATANSSIAVNTPELTAAKSVSPSGSVTPPATLTYTISPSSTGPDLIDTLKVFDSVPLNTTYVNNSASPAPGTFGAYVPIAAQDATDAGPSPATAMAITEGVSPFTYALGSTLTVTMTLTNNDPNNASGFAISNVTGSLTPSDGVSTCVPLSGQPVASIAKNGGTATLTFTCTVNTAGEITWDGNANGTYLGDNSSYDFPTATSPSILGVPTTTGSNVVRWTPGAPNSNTDAIPIQTFGSQQGAGIFAFQGGTSAWERYDIPGNVWLNGTNALPAANGTGAALVYDGQGFSAGYVYALRGGTTTDFWRYALNVSPPNSGTWTARAATPAAVGEGGALTRIGTTIYALRGGNTSDFWKYDTVANTWTALRSIAQPVATALVKAGGALTTDGTYVYALIGNGKNKFYRYDPVANAWAARPNAPWGAKTGAALTYVNGVVYGLAGGGSNHFSKYVIATNKWTNVKNTPANIGDGGALTTDGTAIWALRGNNGKPFYRYNIASNTWTALSNTNGVVNAGGALAWVPAGTTASNTQASTATPVLATSQTTVTVTQVITANQQVTGVTPSITSAVQNGVTANVANCTVSPAGAQTVLANTPFTFTWTCTNVTATTPFGSVTYSTGATGTAPVTNWGTAVANSVLVTPPLTYQVTVPNGTTATQVTNVAVVSEALAGSPFNAGTNAVTTPIIQPAAITATKSVTPTGTVTPGTLLTYGITLQNTTSNTTANVTFSDTIPAGTTYLAASCTASAGAVCTTTGAPVTSISYASRNLGAYGSVTFTFRVAVNSPVSAGTTTISNTGSYTLNGGGSTATNTVSNSVFAAPVLSILKSESNPGIDANGFITPGSTTTYTLAVTNAATNSVPATNVVVKDPVPDGTTYVSCSGGTSCGQSGGIVTYTIANLAVGAPVNLTMTVTNISPAVSGTVIANAASLTADSVMTPVVSNEVSYGVLATPNLTVTKSSYPSTTAVPSGGYTEVLPGDFVTYRVTAKNANATANLIGAYIRDSLPSNVSYVSGSTYVVDPADTTFPWPASSPSWIHVDDTPGSPSLPTIISSLLIYSFPPAYRGDSADGGTLAVGTSGDNTNDAIVQFRVQVNQGLTNGAALDNSAVAGASIPINSGGSQYETSSSTLRHLVFATPNLTLAKSVSPTGQVQTTDSNGYPTVLTYTITLTNTGRAAATGVVVTDTLDTSSVSYPAYVSCTSMFSCSQSFASDGGSYSSPTITWSGITVPAATVDSLGNVTSGTKTLTFQVNPVPRADAGTYPFNNTAQIQSWLKYASATDGTGTTQTPSNNPNNTSNTVQNTLFVPTLVKMRALNAEQNGKDVAITWRTEFESDNLGFNVWREQGGVKTKVNKQLIGGSAFLSRKPTKVSAYVYRFRDKLPSPGFVQYWIEDVDTHRVATMNGPVTPTLTSKPLPDSTTTPLPGLGAGGSVIESPAGVGVLRPTALPPATSDRTKTQLDLASAAALKIYVPAEGWYRISKADMIAAGFDPGSNASKLGLYCAGIEQPIVIDTGGDRSFDPADFIEFYALGLDTVSTGARTYWLRSNGSARLAAATGSGASSAATGVPFTLETKGRSVFVANATNTGDGENFFGVIVGPPWYGEYVAPAQQMLNVRHPDPAATGNATLEVILQGGTDGDHLVEVNLNGHIIGTSEFTSTEQKSFSFTFPQAWLSEGANTLLLTALNGDYDFSALATTRLTYQHAFVADSDLLEVQLSASTTFTIRGFTSSKIRVLDVSDPLAPTALASSVVPDGEAFKVTFATPATIDARTVLVTSSARTLSAPEMTVNRASSLSSTKNGADMVIVTNAAFGAAASALADSRRLAGVQTATVDVEDIYDEFNFGVRSPQAIRSFLQATRAWKRVPRFATLVGDASIDPRDYLGGGSVDFVPTKLVGMIYQKTASDAWLVDFDDDGIENVAIGRLPARTAAEASTMVSKITSRGTPSGSWAGRVLFVSDANTTYDFEASVAEARSLLPAGMVSTVIKVGSDPSPTADTIAALNGGQLVVDYIGHGSTSLWSGFFASADAAALTNGSAQPLVVAMTCENGYFHDVFTESMAEAFIKAPSGGAVAVWASSTLTTPDQQQLMNMELFRQLFGATPLTIGEAITRAKRATSDMDVRRSWILFGDPSMKLK